MNARSEIGVPEVEAEDRDAAGLLVGGGRGGLGRIGVALPGDEHTLRLLRYPDRGHLRAGGARRGGQVTPHHLDVAVRGLQPHHRDWLASANETTDLPSPWPSCWRHAADGTGKLRCRKNWTTCPPTWS